jgi:hypothetical protein
MPTALLTQCKMQTVWPKCCFFNIYPGNHSLKLNQWSVHVPVHIDKRQQNDADFTKMRQHATYPKTINLCGTASSPFSPWVARYWEQKKSKLSCKAFLNSRPVQKVEPYNDKNIPDLLWPLADCEKDLYCRMLGA